jgi:hypothetical protein
LKGCKEVSKAPGFDLPPGLKEQIARLVVHYAALILAQTKEGLLK